MTHTLTLRQKQSEFARCYAELILHAFDLGYEVTLADGAIDPARKYIDSETGKVRRGLDAVHMKGSLHYLRLAADLNLFVSGQLVTNGGHPAWKVLGEYWKTLHPEAAWGGDFDSVDSNHISLRHGGKA